MNMKTIGFVCAAVLCCSAMGANKSTNKWHSVKGLFPENVKTVGIVMPSSVLSRSVLEKGVKMLEEAGYKVKVGDFVRVKEQAAVEDRVKDFEKMWLDPEVDILFMARGGSGAIDWPYMAETLRETGFSVRLKKKDRKYKAFQEAMENCLTAIVLISSEEDDSYWQDTPGHYINLWHYNPETDKVFLGDSGNPNHNRQWVPLRTIYDAISSQNSWQYLLVTDYDEEKNTWKYSGIHEEWTRPSWCKKKPEAHSLLMPAEG